MKRESIKKLKIKDLKSVLAENVLIYDERYENLYQGNLYSVPDWLLNKSIKVMYPAKKNLTEVIVE